MSHRLTRWLLPILAIIGLVVILWLPFGLKVSGIMEEWLVVHDLEHGGASERNEDFDWFITTGVHRLRPLVGLTFVASYSLTPDSFVGYNLVAMALFVGKSVLLYLIMRRLTHGNTTYALLVALLFIIFPADGGLFTFRAINVHLAVLWFLLSVYLFLIYFGSGRRWALVGAWLATVGHLWIYEIPYPLILFMPLLLVWVEGRLNGRVLRASVLWFLAPLFALLYEVVLFTQGESYQSWVLQRSGLTQPGILNEMIASLLTAYDRHFVSGWTESFGQIGTPYLALAVVAALGAFGVGWLMRRAPADEPRRRYWMLALIGFAVIGLGYAMFLISTNRQLDWHVYYYSSIGGAVCAGSLVYLLMLYAHLPRAMFVAIMSLLIGLTTLHALNQHANYADIALSQQRLLHDVVEQAPHIADGATLVVVDETGRYVDNWSLGASYLVRYALGYVYGDPNLSAILCSFDPASGAFVALPEQRELCTFTPEGISLTLAGDESGFYPYDRMVVVRYTGDGAELLASLPPNYLRTVAQRVYNPFEYVDPTASLPRRYYTLFSLPS